METKKGSKSKIVISRNWEGSMGSVNRGWLYLIIGHYTHVRKSFNMYKQYMLKIDKHFHIMGKI